MFVVHKKGENMKIIKAKDYQDMSKKAAIVIASQVTMKPDCAQSFTVQQIRFEKQ